MLVKASPGLRVPKETNATDYITDSDAVDVAESAYYLRRLSDGDLVVVAQPVVDKAAPVLNATKESS